MRTDAAVRPPDGAAPLPYLWTLTALRGVAVTWVALYHFVALGYGGPGLASAAPASLMRGYLAVDLFFVLSGFVLAYGHAGAFGRTGGMAAATRSFWLARVARVYPLFLAVLAVLVVRALMTGEGGRDVSWPAVLANLLLLQVPLGEHSILGASWSLSVEMVSYLAFPILILAVRIARPVQSFAVTYGLMVAATAILEREAGSLDIVSGGALPLLRGVPEFACGMAAARMLCGTRGVSSHRRPALVAGAACAVTTLSLVAGAPDAAVAATLPGLVGGMALWQPRRTGPLHSVAHGLGAISYSLYLLHVPLFTAVARAGAVLAPAAGLPPEAWARANPLVSLVALLVASAGTWRLIESPCRHAILRLAAGGRGQPAGRCVPAVTVCICTFRRLSLADTLRSLSGQKLPAGVEVRVLVLDNDAQPTAAALVDAWARTASLAVSYLHRPGANVADARNACLDAAATAWVAFIDDDCLADPWWLSGLVLRAREGGADVVFGPVRALYDGNVPPWMRRGAFHAARVPRRETARKLAYTTNVLIDHGAPSLAGLRFRTSLGSTGGEDTVFFSDVLARGGNVAFAPDAQVSEIVPPSRQSFGYLLARRLNNGRTLGVILSERHGMPVCIALLLAKSLACCCLCLLCMPSPVGWRHWMLQGALHVGAMLYLFRWQGRRLYGEHPPITGS